MAKIPTFFFLIGGDHWIMKGGNYLNAQKGRGIEDTQRNTQNAALNFDLSFIGGVSGTGGC